MIYFIQAEVIGRIKIGYTSKGRLEKRISALNTASPVPLKLLCVIPGRPELERRLHRRFRSCRVKGEWFLPSDRLVAFIAKAQGRTIAATQTQPARGSRSVRAADWLRGVFRDRTEITSVELMAMAREAGVSRNALYGPDVAAMPIRKRLRVLSSGEKCWVWTFTEEA